MSKEEQETNSKPCSKEENLINKLSQRLIESPKKITKNSPNVEKQLSVKRRKETKNCFEQLGEQAGTNIKGSPNFKGNLKKDLSSKIIINEEKNVFHLT